MRSIWKGTISFGLVNVPVKLYSATSDHDISLHQVHDKDGGRVRYQRRCEKCGQVVDYEHIDKAYAEDDKTVVLTDEDLAALPVEHSREIEVVEFVPTDQIDPLLFDRSYFLEPDSRSIKSYVLLRRTLEESEQTAIVRFALRQRTQLGALRARGDVLTVQSLLWNDELRSPAFDVLDQETKVTAKELKMSAELVKSMSEDFEPDRFTDEYQEQLRTLIEAKLEHGESLDTEATFGKTGSEAGGEVIDLMEALRKSVQKNKKKTASKRTSKPTPTKKRGQA